MFFQSGHQRFEVFHHRTSGDVFAGRFLQNFTAVLGAAFFQDVVQPRADLFVVGIVTRVRWLMRNLARDAIKRLWAI